MYTTAETKYEFEQYAETGNAFIKELGNVLGTHKPGKTLRILKRVFSGLRSHLPFHESINTIEILPMAIRGLYVEGWELRSSSPNVATTTDFITAIMGGKPGKTKEFNDVDDAIMASLAVIETIAQFAFPGISEDATDLLPRGLRNLYHTLIRISSRNTYTYRR